MLDNKINKWDTHFISLAYFIATKSKDPSSKLGAVIINKRNAIISTGYNGPARGVDDSDPTIYERPKKYLYFAHAERNAIYNAASLGVSTQDSKLYTPGIPCCGCAVAIINSGIREVVVHNLWEKSSQDRWKIEALETEKMFNDAAVILKKYEGPIINTFDALLGGELISLKAE